MARPLSLATRLALRDIASHRARSVLIVLLIALPIAVIGVLPSAGSNESGGPPLQAEFGDAQARLEPLEGADGVCRQLDLTVPVCTDASGAQPGFTPTPIDKAVLPNATLDVVSTTSAPLTWRSTTLDAPIVVVDVTRQSDRFLVSPKVVPGPDEVLLVAAQRDLLALGVGDTITLGTRTLTIAGVVRTEVSVAGWFVVGPDHPLAAHATPVEALVRGRVPDSTEIAALNRQGIAVVTREAVMTSGAGESEADLATAAIVVFVAVLALLITGTIASAAFAIGVRQQRRTLSLIAATGAPSRVVRGIVARQGLILGVIAGLVGFALAVGGGMATHALIESTSPGYPAPARLPWALLTTLAALGVLTATISAMVPARQVTSLDALAAVRSAHAPAPPPRRPRWAVALAVAGVAIGIGGALLARMRRDPGMNHVEQGVLPAVASVVLVFAAVVLSLGWLLHLAADLLGRGPLALRLAARDWTRNRSRATAAMAATVAMMTLATSVLTMTASVGRTSIADWRPSMPQGFIAVGSGDPTAPATSEAAQRRVIAAVEKVMTPGAHLSLRSPLAKASGGMSVMALSLLPTCEAGSCVSNGSSGVVVGDAALVAQLTRAPASPQVTEVLAKGGVVVFDDELVSDGTVSMVVGQTTVTLPAVQVASSGAPAVISAATAQRLVPKAELGQPSIWLDVGRTPTRDEQTLLGQAVREADPEALVGITFEPGPVDDYAPINRGFTAFFAALLIGLASIVTSLSLRDGRSSLTILANNGARPRTLRAMTSAHATVTTTVGMVMGLVVSLVSVVPVLIGAHPVVRVAIPWGWLGALVLVVPVALALVGWLVPPPRPAAVRAD